MANEKNVKNEEMIEKVDEFQVDKSTGEVKNEVKRSMVDRDAYSERRNTDEGSDTDFDGDITIYHTGYNMSRHSNKTDPKTGVKYYNYAFGYSIIDGHDKIPQTVYVEPSDTGREAYDVLDKIFKGGDFAELEIVKTIRRRTQNGFTRVTNDYKARVSKKLASGAEISCDFNIVRGNNNKFDNLINILKADGVIG